MKYKLLSIIILFIVCLMCQNCSWICRFFIVNTGENPVNIEMKLSKSATSFPIFHYRELYLYDAPHDKVENGNTKEFLVDTLEDHSHFKFSIAAHTAVEIGRLQNDKYEKHDQHFINGRVFNLETLKISKGEKEINIIPETFDSYFKKGKYGEVFYYVK